LFAAFIAVASVAIVGGLATAIVVLVQRERSPTFELRKADWHCTAHHQETRLLPIHSGKTTIIVPQSDDVCDTYVRVGR
jgi:hypothetical protein